MTEWEISTPRFESDTINPSLEVSPWCGHRNFVYDYLKYIKPQKMIELGTHYGCSFFAMCQSMKDNWLNTKLYAVDTWEGDEQAGFYGAEVWESVNKIKKSCFGEQDTVFMRMLFNDAVKEFEDETFDLIHIDGLHSYEAVSEDFRSWLPKLRKDGVILFHDVNSEKKYGTDIFWEEIKQEYPCYFEFSHSWGLGVLFPKGDRVYKQLLSFGFLDKCSIYQYKALYTYEMLKTRDLTQMADERYEAIQKQSCMIDERDAVIRSQKELINEKDEGIRKQSRMIDERDAAIRSQKGLIDEKDKGICRQNHMIDERDAVIRSQKELIDEKDEGIRKQSCMIDERDAVIRSQKELIDEKDEGIRKQSCMIDERDAVIRSQKELIDEKDEGIRRQSCMIDERDAVIESQKELIDEKDEGIRNQSRMIDDMKGRIAEYSDKTEHLEKLMQKVYRHKIISKWILKGEI